MRKASATTTVNKEGETVGFINSIYLLLAAFTLTNTPILEYLQNRGQIGLSANIGYMCLILTTIGSLVILFKESKYWIPTITVVMILYGLVIYEKHVDYYGTVKEFSSNFLVHGIGGLLIGLAINNYKLFFKYVVIISFIYSIVFLLEPVNHNLLGSNAMSTGYTILEMVIFLIMAYFTNYRNQYVLILAILSSIIIILFSSRGCGIALGVTWVTFFIWNQKKKGVSLKKDLIKLVLLLLVAYFILSSGVDYVVGSHLNVSEGSLVEKIMSGYVESSNGRDELYEAGISMIRQSSLTGMGFGADRAGVVGFYVHNIILELLIDFGIPLSIVILVLYWRTTILGIRSDLYSLKAGLIMALVFSTWVQLLFSSSYLQEMLGIMLIIGVSIRAKNENRRKIIGTKIK